MFDKLSIVKKRINRDGIKRVLTDFLFNGSDPELGLSINMIMSQGPEMNSYDSF